MVLFREVQVVKEGIRPFKGSITKEKQVIKRVWSFTQQNRCGMGS
ncbi:hypothetical protein ACIGEL_13320 [Rossellomorea aquimaris]